MRASQLSLSNARDGDLEGVLQLLNAVNLTVEGVSQNLESFIIVRDADSNLIGVAGLEYYGASALLRSVAVSELHRGEGIGHLLVERCVAESKRRKAQHLYLLTETAEKFMQRFGFRPVDKGLVDSRLQASEEFKGACPDTAVTMLLELQLHSAVSFPRPSESARKRKTTPKANNPPPSVSAKPGNIPRSNSNKTAPAMK